MEYPEYTKVIRFNFLTEECDLVGYEKNDMDKLQAVDKVARELSEMERDVRVPCFGTR